MTGVTIRPMVPLSGLVRLVRPGAVLASSTISLVGASLASPEGWLTVGLAMVAVGFAVGSSNVFNDILDLEADRINVPDRPLPSGRVSTRAALAWCSSLALVAVLAAVPLGVAHALTVVAVLGVSAWYSTQLKRILIVGPLVVSALLALALVFGATVGTSLPPAVWVGAAEIGVFTFGRETLKGVRDVEGDRSVGVATVASVWGPRAAVVVFAVCCGIVITVSAMAGSAAHFAVMTLLVGLPGVIGAVVWWDSDRDLPEPAISGSAWLWVTGLAGITLL